MSNNNLFLKASSPESLGIPSSAILNFLERIDRQQTCMHGFLLLRKGKIAAEGYWAPYTENSMHRMYSVSKSFVSMAIGLMIDEGKLTLNDRVADFFKDKVSENLHPYLTETTIRDLLIMATPHNSTSYSFNDNDWAATFFQTEPSHPPGTVFSYDTAGTVILNTIVERVSGLPFLEYMRKKLLDPIGVSKDVWCIKTPEGTSWGGSGVICRLRDMARMAYMCMNKGRWNDTQLISEEYIEAATSKQIDNSIKGGCGYGYQIWMTESNGFAFRGMGSQLAFCFPDKDLLFTCISDTQGSGVSGSGAMGAGISDSFYEEIFNKIQDSSLPEDTNSYNMLKNKIESLKILPQRGSLTSTFQQKINGMWYNLSKNRMGILKTRFVFKGDIGVWEYENATGEHQFVFGIGKIIAGSFPQNNYYGEKIGTISGKCYDCLSSAAWVEEHKLNMLVYVTDIYLGSLRMSFSFKGNEISIQMIKVAEGFLNEYMGFAGGHIARDA